MLIAAVQKREALFDKTNANYCNRNFTQKEWVDVAGELGEEGLFSPPNPFHLGLDLEISEKMIDLDLEYRSIYLVLFVYEIMTKRSINENPYLTNVEVFFFPQKFPFPYERPKFTSVREIPRSGMRKKYSLSWGILIH